MPLQTRCNGLFKQHFSLDRRVKGKIVTTHGNHKGGAAYIRIFCILSKFRGRVPRSGNPPVEKWWVERSLYPPYIKNDYQILIRYNIFVTRHKNIVVEHNINRRSAQALSRIRIKLFIIFSQQSKQFQLVLIQV